jgi:hypothetical protein
MSTRIPIVAVMLTAAICASPATAHPPQEANQRVQSSRQETRAAQRQSAAQRRGGQAGTEVTEAFSRTTRLVSGGTFDLINSSGNVTITGGSNGREVRIEGMKRVRNVANVRAQAMLNAIQIAVAERGGNIEVRTVAPRGFARNTPANRPAVIVDYVIVLPDNTNVVLRTTSGDLRLENVSGDQFVLDTLSGHVRMQASKGRMLEVHTVTGNVELQDMYAERALLQSTAGNVVYIGELLRNGQYRFGTHKGNIRVAPTGATGFDLDARTHKGAVRTDFVVKRMPQAPRGVTRGWRGTVGDARAALTIFTFSGDIDINKP